ncbi:tRNA1Val (adenine37-N6)-methyltransferase [Natranaerovirga pectinivora]|uniref:tRNA1Val (Adenine37-N6)-methyltransferase n=1 Tax=Natranaerovirga pectinivora TaxID=682400 RepID=A0A4R3MDW8_9FIRM|nr:tRNA1(Val) (adenine(37)-N6)-methyltransferase [Natranaerovirga pectinivora]TCT11681.1 tRNA1Val (adenine37-N6)-methyltransferase [Natranaerovirga pectinivora]
MSTVGLKANERIDELHINNYKIIQDPNSFCFGMDPILLTGFIDTEIKGRVLDLGTGTGIIPILLEAKTKATELIGLEIQSQSADMASRSVKLNSIENKVSIVEGDIKNADNLFPLSSFDVITSNPPYMVDNNGLKNNNTPKTIARHEVLCTLEDVIRVSSRLVKVGGKVYLVHRPNRLVDIISLFKKYKLEPKRMRLVHPFIDKEPNMLLIEAVRHGGPMMKIEKPLIVYKEKGVYTEEIYEIYGMNKGESNDR